MNISLTPELERFVNQKVESGKYQTASEVVRDGLRLLLEREELHHKKLEDLRRDIAVGLDQADQGKVAPFNEETIARVKARARQRQQARRTGKA
jgi:antitoxin ParD1/3/4